MKKTTPFKAQDDFEKELIQFANIHKQTMMAHSSRISDYFEMTCYNMIVSFYENMKYKISVQNLQSGKFRYKCSPNGRLENFSYFKARKENLDGAVDEFYIFHNATVQSAYDDHVFTTPDIVVAKTNNPAETTDYYETRRALTYIIRENLITFCEAKHLSPFPELLINFVGTVNELMPSCIKNDLQEESEVHFAPSLMVSGVLNKPTRRIKESLESRYVLNIVDNLIEYNATFKFFIKNKEELNMLKINKVH